MNGAKTIVELLEVHSSLKVWSSFVLNGFSAITVSISTHMVSERTYVLHIVQVNMYLQSPRETL